MWSPYYKYYQIRKDKNRSEKVSLKRIELIISELEIFQKKGNVTYETNESFPRLSLTLINTASGNYSINSTTSFEEINLIEIITSRRPATSEDWYLEIIKNLALTLKWEAILEIGDEDNDEIIIK